MTIIEFIKTLYRLALLEGICTCPGLPYSGKFYINAGDGIISIEIPVGGYYQLNLRNRSLQTDEETGDDGYFQTYTNGKGISRNIRTLGSDLWL